MRDITSVAEPVSEDSSGEACSGTPEEVARVAESHTGRFLAELLA